jgi:DNA-binding NtrC family response regulator
MWRKHLLFIEDEEAMRKVVKRYFFQYGYRVTTVENGEQAIAVLDDASVDLVILDLVLPGISGMDLLAWMTETHPRLPCVVYTGLGFHEDVFEEAKNAGAAGYVSKGLPLNQLLLEVHRLLDYGQPSPQPM